MGEHRFLCTACGQCCYGLLPLTVDEAMERSGMLPLAISMTPIEKSAQRSKYVEAISVRFTLGGKKTIRLNVSLVSFVPATMPCPALTSDNLCSIHEEKPVRCRTMPFYPYRDESQQASMLTPRSGWLCATGEDAPVVYKDHRIVNRTDFDREQMALAAQTASLQRYAELLVRHDPFQRTRLLKVASSAGASRVIVSFLSYLRYNKDLDMLGFAARQYPVLKEWAEKTAADPKLSEFYRYYTEAAAELARYL